MELLDIIEKINQHLVGTQYKFEKILDKGAYGVVFECKIIGSETDEPKYVAIKLIENIFKNKFRAKSTLREIKILNFIHHPNVIELLDWFCPKEENFNEILIVMEKINTNLNQVIKDTSFDYLEEYGNLFIKVILYQIICGIYYLHSCMIIHRDIKPGHILIGEDPTILRICDFKTAINNEGEKEPEVGTVCYFAPEMLGSISYDEKIDIWGIGCIMLELYTRKIPYFCPEENENDIDRDYWFKQINSIFKILGKPEEDVLENIFNSQKLADVIDYCEDYPKKEFKEILPENVDEHAADLLEKLLELNPKKRCSAKEALEHPYFNEIRERKKYRLRAKNKNTIKIDLKLEPDNPDNVMDFSESEIEEMQVNYCKKEIMKIYKDFKALKK